MTSETDSIAAFLDAENIEGAKEALVRRIRAKPEDSDARLRYIDLLIAAEDYERADKQADILSTMNVKLSFGLALLRGRIRAAHARQAWFEQGSAPTFPTGPSEADQETMKRWVDRRAGIAEAAETTEGFEGAPARVNGAETQNFRDIDDRIPHAFEAFASDGSYLWLDFASLSSVAFEPLEHRLREIAWRTARVTMRNGSTSELALPTKYFARESDNEHKLARKTDWLSLGQNSYAGVGQKCFLAGDDLVEFLSLERIEFL